MKSYLKLLSCFFFQRWFETVFEEVLSTFGDIQWLEEQILLHPYLEVRT